MSHLSNQISWIVEPLFLHTRAGARLHFRCCFIKNLLLLYLYIVHLYFLHDSPFSSATHYWKWPIKTWTRCRWHESCSSMTSPSFPPPHTLLPLQICHQDLFLKLAIFRFKARYEQQVTASWCNLRFSLFCRKSPRLRCLPRFLLAFNAYTLSCIMSPAFW